MPLSRIAGDGDRFGRVLQNGPRGFRTRGRLRRLGRLNRLEGEACHRKLDPDDIHAAENGARACSLLGALYVAGDGIPKDLAKGQELSELGCERGDSFGCFNAAAGATDPAETARYLDMACKGGDAEGCFDLGVAYEKGRGVAVDRKQSTALIRKACQMGFAPACPKKKG